MQFCLILRSILPYFRITIRTYFKQFSKYFIKQLFAITLALFCFNFSNFLLITLLRLHMLFCVVLSNILFITLFSLLALPVLFLALICNKLDNLALIFNYSFTLFFKKNSCNLVTTYILILI